MPQSPSEPAAEAEASGLGDYLSAWLAIGEMSRQGASWSGRERNSLYLNSTDGRFADFSAVSGADFPDDARAVAVTDWDGDGDLDLWLANRTGPRVRFLRNRSGNGRDSVAFRLRGTRSNRDAIGARVRLSFGSAGRTVVQSLRAGEGFLAQSSKWIHFGLGRDEPIQALEVHWPGGELESFRGVRAGGRFLLQEGSGIAQPLPDRAASVALRPSTLETSIESGASHVRLTARPVMPPIDYRTFSAEPRRLAIGDGALLLNLWASWCAPCVTELRELELHREELAAAGLSIVAISVDEEPDRARELLETLRPRFDVGLASMASLDVLDILQKALLEERRRLALPMSFLIDPKGRLAVLYKGPVKLEELGDDLKILSLDDFGIRAATAPLPGRWTTLPTRFPHNKLAGEFASFGHSEIAELYRRLAGRPGAMAPPDDAIAADPIASDIARAFELLERGERAQAEALLGGLIEQLAQQLRARPDDTTARNRLGIVLIGLNRPGMALQAFEQVLEIDPNDVHALTNAAVLSWRGGRSERAQELVERLSRVDPAGAAEVRHLMTLNR